MSNATFAKYFTLNFLMVLRILLSSEKLFSQGEPDSTFTLANKAIVSASFQYQNLPDTWDIMYGGLTWEFYLNDNLSVSGSFYFGKGSDDRYYAHFPIAGGFILFPFVWLAERWGIYFEGLEPGNNLVKLLITENVYYNLRN